MKSLSLAELDAGLDQILQSPQDAGVLELIVRRPQTGPRVAVDHFSLGSSRRISTICSVRSLP